jgi:hypothetical protein
MRPPTLPCHFTYQSVSSFHCEPTSLSSRIKGAREACSRSEGGFGNRRAKVTCLKQRDHRQSKSYQSTKEQIASERNNNWRPAYYGSVQWSAGRGNLGCQLSILVVKTSQAVAIFKPYRNSLFSSLDQPRLAPLLTFSRPPCGFRTARACHTCGTCH